MDKTNERNDWAPSAEAGGAAQKQPAGRYAVEWDLVELLPSLEKSDVDAAIHAVEAEVRQIEQWRGKLDTIDDPQKVADLFNRLSDLQQRVSRIGGRGRLAFSTNTGDEQVSAFLGRFETLDAGWDNRVRFVSLWWKSLPEEKAQKLMPADDDLAHFARRLRTFAPHTLSESEEKIISIKDVTGASAIGKTRDLLTSAMMFTSPVTGKPVTASELMNGSRSPKPEIREKTYEELWNVWSKQETVFSHIYSTVVRDWYNEQVTLRKYPKPISPRNRYNDVPDEAVDALLSVCREKRSLFQNYFQWKGKQLGLEKMTRHHIYAPLKKEEEEKISFDEGVDRVFSVFDGFDPEIGKLARRIFDERHVDVHPRKGKRGGAYCATINTKMTPFLFLNWTGDSSSLKTLAHETGHGIHSMLAENRNPLVSHAGLCLAETASVFSEMLLHDAEMKSVDGNKKTDLISGKLGEIYATVMRQGYFARFELEAHDAIREGATTKQVHDIYLDNLREQFGPVEVPDNFRYEWTYIPHFCATPFYVYAYSFGMLLSLALYDMYKEQGDSFVPKYKRILSAGGSVSPEHLLKEVIGVDIRDEEFWKRGFSVIERMTNELESAQN